ncbi:melatonin receptor type 1B-like isoform X2 [Pecten maximus]|uniref:melatonin receptor type 1B-like isoform X2 n=1 Tax=Pecten maximus TaxID=6579 RepID=UPI0014586CB8|nr:melatonin receptor type 1B-like isoform X2 [Pecten maximus]
MERIQNCQIDVAGNKSLTNGTNSSEADSSLENVCNSTGTEAVAVLLPPLLESNFSLALLYIVLMSVLMVLGTFGNVLIIMISACNNAFNKVGKAFMVNLAIADLCVAGLADPMCILGVIKGATFFDDKLELCHFIASMCLTACFCAFLSLTMLTINRCFYVCHNTFYQKFYTRVTTGLMCSICWIVAFLCEFPNFVGWGAHTFDEKNHQCIWDRTASLSYSLFVSICLIGGPLVVMGICNIRIVLEIWQKKKNIYELDSDGHYPSLKAWNETVRTSKTLFIIFTLFMMCWTPYAVVIAIDIGDRLSMEVHLFVTMIAHTHSSLNCIIYIFSNQRFRRSALGILGCRCTQIKGPTSHSSESIEQKTLGMVVNSISM